MENSKTNLEELANLLVLNNITNSIEAYNDEIITEIVNKENSTIAALNKQSRYILLVGAGASNSVTNQIFRAPEAANWIMSQVSKNNNITNSLIQKELNRINQVYKLNIEDFETKLFAISKFFPSKVKEYLQKLFNHKYEVSLVYDIIGHLLKHRFIDVVINYNFDELLDNVIQEEMKSQDFTIIHADGQCPENYQEEVIHKNNRGLKGPIYIKPHGTVSHPSTMRFTREDYYKISNEINTLINNLFQGENNHEKYQYEVNLIIVGFGMRSFELNEIIKRKTRLNSDSQNRKINSYFFEYKTKEDLESGLKEEELLDCLNVKHIHCPTGDIFDSNFKLLWELIQGRFKEQFRPKDISRHLLLCDIFSQKRSTLNSYSSKKQYFKDRIFVEISIGYLSSDGLLNLVQIENGRIGKYYKLYRKEGGRKLLSSFLNDMDIIYYKNYVPDTFQYRTPGLINDTPIICELMHRKLLGNIKNKITQDNIRNKKETIIQDHFKSIRSTNLLSVNYDENIKFSSKFENLANKNLIRTSLHWSFEFRKELEKVDDWDILLTVSEKGRFLLNEKNHRFFEGKKLEVITASFDHIEMDTNLNGLEGFKKRLVSNKLLKLPWWLHNQHLILFLKEENMRSRDTVEYNIRPICGFYYSSRLLNRAVSPMFIDDRRNLSRIFEIFINYWHTANLYMDGKGAKNFSSYEELISVRKTLLKKCKEKKFA